VTAAATTAASSPPAVLIIDDEDYVAELIATALRLEGYTTSTCYNGREGLLQAQNQPFDLIIIDMMMPYLSGDDLALQLRAIDTTRDTPIVLMSAGTRPRYALTNAVFVPKPFDIEHFLNVVETQLTHDEQLRAAPQPAPGAPREPQ
jgi:DNA-binding response OmpR family regulator